MRNVCDMALLFFKSYTAYIKVWTDMGLVSNLTSNEKYLGSSGKKLEISLHR